MSRDTYKVYLSGPMKGMSFKDSAEWRNDVMAKFPDHIKGLDPFRGKHEYLKDVTVLNDSYREIPLTTAEAITCRDRWDATRCDVLLVNVLGADRVSIGTIMEVAWADLKQIPIVLVMEPGNIHSHAIFNEVCSYIVPTLDEGIEIVKVLLTP